MAGVVEQWNGSPNAGSNANAGDGYQSVVDTLRRADEALRKADMPVPNGVIVKAPMLQEERRYVERSPVINTSFGGVSNVVGTSVSPPFTVPSPPREGGAVHAIPGAEAQHVVAANRLYGSQNRDRSPLVHVRQSSDPMGGVEIVGRAHFGGADIPHRNASPQIFQQNALFSSAQQSTQAQVVVASTAIPQKTVVMDFLSDKAREILRQTGQEPGDPGIEHRLWSSLNESQLRQNPGGSQGLDRSLQNAQAREDSTYLSYPRSSGYNEEFVRKMDEELQSLRRKLHQEQEAREQTAERFRACSINLEHALAEKERIQRALEKAASSTGQKEWMQKHEQEKQRRESAERMIDSLQGQLKAAKTETEAQASAVRSVTGALDLKDVEIRRREEELQRLQAVVRTKEDELLHKEEELRGKDQQLHNLKLQPNAMVQVEATAKKSQAEAQEMRDSALAMAQQLKRCVSDLAAAQKRLNDYEKRFQSQDKAKTQMKDVMEELKKALAESTDLNDAAKEEITFLRKKTRELEQDKVELQRLQLEYEELRAMLNDRAPSVQSSLKNSLSMTKLAPSQQHLLHNLSHPDSLVSSRRSLESPRLTSSRRSIDSPGPAYAEVPNRHAQVSKDAGGSSCQPPPFASIVVPALQRTQLPQPENANAGDPELYERIDDAASEISQISQLDFELETNEAVQM